MIKNLKKKLIAGLLTLSVFATVIPATDVYAASGYNGLNGTEVIQLSHVHDYYGAGVSDAFSIGNYRYGYSLCVNPIRYTDGHSEDCNEVLYYKTYYLTEKETYISEATFKKAYRTWRKAVLTNGGVSKWSPNKYKPKQLSIDNINRLRVLISNSDFLPYASMDGVYGTDYIGYEIRISTNKNMKNSKVYSYLKGAVSQDRYTGKKGYRHELVVANFNKKYIKKGKTYYVQVRPVGKYKVVKGGKYYELGDLKDGKYEKVVQKTKKLYGTWSDKVKLKVGTTTVNH